MKLTKEQINSGVTILLVVLIAILIFTIFKKNNNNNSNTSVNDIIAAKDQTLQILQDQLNEGKEEKKHTKQLFQSYYILDSITRMKILSNQPKYKTNDKKMQDANDNTIHLTKDELRREYANH